MHLLRHPWPRSQIVAALVKPLPDEVELKEISIVREPIAASGTATMPPDKLGDAAAEKSTRKSAIWSYCANRGTNRKWS